MGVLNVFRVQVKPCKGMTLHGLRQNFWPPAQHVGSRIPLTPNLMFRMQPRSQGLLSYWPEGAIRWETLERRFRMLVRASIKISWDKPVSILSTDIEVNWPFWKSPWGRVDYYYYFYFLDANYKWQLVSQYKLRGWTELDSGCSFTEMIIQGRFVPDMPSGFKSHFTRD